MVIKICAEVLPNCGLFISVMSRLCVHSGNISSSGTSLATEFARDSSLTLCLAFTETESWHLLSSLSESGPAARHKHSAVLHGDAMYIYGGMTDLQERNDCWRWDVNSASWSILKNKPGPGPLHGHAACRLPSCMLIFGGESGGLATNELWRFHFGTCVGLRIFVVRYFS